VLARWRLGDGAVWTLAVNLGAEPCALTRPAGEVIFETAAGADALAQGQLAGHTTIALLEPSRG
jgi:maltooligosyltrehalose trehalohydrolase